MKTFGVLAAGTHPQLRQQRIVGVAFAHPDELFANDLRFDAALSCDGNVLPIASAAATGHSVRAPRHDAIGRCGQYLLYFGAYESLPQLGQFHAHSFTGNPETDEHHLTVMPADGVSAMRRTIEVEFDDIADCE